jgi:hypothetical protein
MIGRFLLEFHDLPLDDEKTLEMIAQGMTEGIHTIQGKESRRGCVEVGVESVHDVILVAALYRPANTREGKDKLYVERRKGLEVVDYPHEVVERIVGPSHGVPVFQEQAMEIVYAAGGDDGFVDDVYQGIKKAKGAGRGAKEIFDKLSPKFVKLCRRNLGVSEKTALEIWEYVQAFQGYGFNKGHATSYGILAVKIAYLKRWHPAEFFAALLDVFPERANYIAAARSEGYIFLQPDVNRSMAGFGIDKTQENSIRVGLGKVHGLGPVAVNEIVQGQPFSDYDDFKARTTRRSINATKLENLGRLGALESLGVRGERDDVDAIQFQLIGFTLAKPRAFRGCKPRFVSPRESGGGWKHLGREKGVELTQGRTSVSKLFWLPPYSEIEDRKKLFELKASPWAQVKTWLLTAVDENGLPLHLMVNEDKQYEVKLLKFLYERCERGVVCLDGTIRLPFVQNGPQGFRVFGVTGAYNGEPQLWHVKKEKLYKQAITELDAMKRRSRYQ